MSTPLWRQMFNSWEKAVAPGLEELTASNGFRDVMAAGLKVNADVAREIERASRQWLHLWNLPAATDIRKLRKQVSGLERELLALRLELERSGRAAVRPLAPAPDLNSHAPDQPADDTAAA
jgi:hypothetical protein